MDKINSSYSSINNRERLTSIIQFITLLGIAIFVAYLSSFFISYFAIATIIILLIVIIIWMSLTNLKISFIIILFLSFFLWAISRYLLPDSLGLPIGLLLDFQTLFLVIGLIFLKGDKSVFFHNNVISILILVYLGYNFLELFNPAAASREAWFYAIRPNLRLVVVYFVVFYLSSDKKFIYTILKIWIFIVFLAAIYGLYQEFFGILKVDAIWLVVKDRLNLYTTWGRLRKFSFFNSPMTFGLLLAFTSVLSIILSMGPFKKTSKIFLMIAAFVMIWALMYTNTRTAYAVLPIGLIFYAFLSLNKKIIIFTSVILLIGAAIIMVSNNPSFYIFKTAFKGSEDPSMNLRLMNQQRIKPHIQSHPIGWGLGSTGGMGIRFSPYTAVGSFPPDSEYVVVAIEMGWIGLLFFLFLLGMIFKQGITNYYKLKDKQLKFITGSLLAVFLMFIIAFYPQEALAEPPMDVVFSICIALLAKMTHHID